MILKLGVLALLQVVSLTIGISVSSQQERCMIVSSNDEEQFLKIDLKFERFSQQTLEEGYRVVLHNTETHEEEAFQVYEGNFRKEFKLTQNVVYRLCFKIVLTEFRKISQLIDYNAGIKHKFSISESKVSVPDKLLKSKDLRQTYTYLSRAKELMERVNKENEQIKGDETVVFDGQRDKMETFKWTTLSEIVVICLLGGYQYWKLKGIIDHKQKI